MDPRLAAQIDVPALMVQSPRVELALRRQVVGCLSAGGVLAVALMIVVAMLQSHSSTISPLSALAWLWGTILALLIVPIAVYVYFGRAWIKALLVVPDVGPVERDGESGTALLAFDGLETPEATLARRVTFGRLTVRSCTIGVLRDGITVTATAGGIPDWTIPYSAIAGAQPIAAFAPRRGGRLAQFAYVRIVVAGRSSPFCFLVNSGSATGANAAAQELTQLLVSHGVRVLDAAAQTRN